MPIAIVTGDLDLAKDIQASAPGGVSVSRRDWRTRSMNAGALFLLKLKFIKDASGEVDVALCAAWLYDKIKSNNGCYIHNGQHEIIKSKPVIQRCMQEELNIPNGNKGEN